MRPGGLTDLVHASSLAFGSHKLICHMTRVIIDLSYIARRGGSVSTTVSRGYLACSRFTRTSLKISSRRFVLQRWHAQTGGHFALHGASQGPGGDCWGACFTYGYRIKDPEIRNRLLTDDVCARSCLFIC